MRRRPADALLTASARVDGEAKGADRLPAILVILALLIGAQLIAKAPSFDTTTAEQVAFGAVVAISLCGAAAGALSSRRLVVSGVLLLWSALMLAEAALYALEPAGSGRPPASDFLTDLIVMMLPTALALALAGLVRTRSDLSRLFVIVIVLAMVAGVVSYVFAVPEVRFRPPPNVAIAGAWALATVSAVASGARRSSMTRWRLLAWIPVILLVPFIMASQSRTGAIAWIICGGISLALPGLQRRRWKWIVILCAAAVVLFLLPGAGATVLQRTSESAAQTRLDLLASRTSDVSTLARVREVEDVISTVERDGSPLDHLLGLGHGASYAPSSGLIAVNVDPQTDRVHNVHNTLALVYLRYGLVGLAVYLALLLSMIVAATRDFRRHRDFLGIVLVMSTGVFILDALVRNSFADPTFALVIAALSVSARADLRATPEPQ